MNGSRLAGNLVTELIFAPAGVIAIYIAWKAGKIGLSIVTRGYVEKGAGFQGKPEQDVEAHSLTGCLLLMVAAFGLFAGLFFIIGWMFFRDALGLR